MTSAGSFVYGSDGRRKTSTDEQDIADFLSSIENDIAGAEAAGGARAAAPEGISLRGGGTSPGMDLLFGPASPSTQGAEYGSDRALLLGDSEEGIDAAPGDWLRDLESSSTEHRGDSSASLGVDQQATSRDDGGQPHQQQQKQQQQQRQRRVEEEEEEVLGAEPEILDVAGYDDDDHHAGSSSSSYLHGSRHDMREQHAPSSRHDARRSSAATANVDPFAGGRKARPGATQSPTTGMNEVASADEPLDWPGTLDMLGMAADGQKAGSSSSTAPAVPASELPSMAPPAAREESFPDFVEIRDPRRVSQFPKPDNVLAAKAAGRQGSGDAGAGPGQRQVLAAPLRTVEVYLRPDVTWESVSDVYMAVMLSRGLVVRQQTEKSVTAEKAADGSGDWGTVKLTAGVTRDKLRTLVMQFYADTRAPILSLAGTMARFSGRAGDELYTAIRDALVERRMPLSMLATDAAEVSLDPHYIRDLVGMYAHENVVNLTRYALPLEEFVRGEEERSARLEATLLPQYRATGLVPPRPMRSKALSAYPLTTRRPPVSSCGVEEAKEVMERAREHAGLADRTEPDEGGNKLGGVSDAGSGGVSEVSVAEGIRSLIRATWEDVKEWCDEEAEARVRRKDSQVRDRLLAVERHREALIAVLRDGAGGAAATRTPVGREFAARFRPMAEEAVLCHCKAVHAKRVGQLYLTCSHLCFHSSVLGFTSQRVLPLLTVMSISHASSALGMNLVTLTDHGGEEHSFGITSVEAGFPQRLHDLLQQCLLLCKAEASRRAAKEGDAANDEPDEEQILEKVQRLAKAKQLREARETASAATAAATAAASATSLLAPPVTPPSPSIVSEVDGSGVWEASGVTADAGSLEASAGGALGAGGLPAMPAAAVTTKEGTTGDGQGGQGGTAGARGGGAGGGRGGPGSMMAMGIQAFLEESQKRS